MISKLPIDVVLFFGFTALFVLMVIILSGYSLFIVRPRDKEITRMFYQRFGCYPASVEFYHNNPHINYFQIRNGSYYQILRKEKNHKYFIKGGITHEQHDFIRSLPLHLTAPLLRERMLQKAACFSMLPFAVSFIFSKYFS